MRTAEFWQDAGNGFIQCGLCPHRCRLEEGHTGLCRVRSVRDGRLIAEGFGFVSSSGVDPIEKKPLYHFHPGTAIFSFGGWGCNLGCRFCQNWSISQRVELKGSRCSPTQLVEAAVRSGSIGIAYTYNEPLIGIEYVMECAELARARGLVNVLVTNGYVEAEPASRLLPLIDALNIDIKSMDEMFYRVVCHGSLRPVLDFAVKAAESHCHVEITNLLIPGLNDDDTLVLKLANWVRDSLGPATVLHLSAYHRDYRSTEPATPVETLLNAHRICSAELMYVYLGNVRSNKGADTVCPGCGNTLIARRGYDTRVTGLSGGTCAKCGRKADVVS